MNILFNHLLISTPIREESKMSMLVMLRKKPSLRRREKRIVFTNLKVELLIASREGKSEKAMMTDTRERETQDGEEMITMMAIRIGIKTGPITKQVNTPIAREVVLSLTLVKKETGVSRSRSRSQDRRSYKRDDKKGKKSVASKNSFTSDYLHQAWGKNNEANWDKLGDEANDGWGAKSEIKTENDWAGGNQSTKNEDWARWQENKTHRTNDQDSNW